MPELPEDEIPNDAENLSLSSHARTNVKFRRAYADYRGLKMPGEDSQEKFVLYLLDYFYHDPRKRTARGDTARKFT